MNHRSFASGLFALVIGSTSIIVACSSDGSTPGVGTADAAPSIDSSSTDSSTPSNPDSSPDSSTPGNPDSSADSATDGGAGGPCGLQQRGCVKGPSGNGKDFATVTAVTGLVDGQSDTVMVTGTYHLESAATASVALTCDGQSSSTDLNVSTVDGPFSLTGDFQICAADVVKITVYVTGGSKSNNYVKCCFKKGVDF